MNLKKLFLSITAVFALVAAVALTTYTLTPNSTVSTPEVKKISKYQPPVREGNCWRQWNTAGNSMLVCH